VFVLIKLTIGSNLLITNYTVCTNGSALLRGYDFWDQASWFLGLYRGPSSYVVSL